MARFFAALIATGVLGFATDSGAASALLDQRSVNAAEFAAYLASQGKPNPYTNNSTKEPAVQIDWHQARAFCRARGKRLPTVPEWVAACKAKSIGFPHWIWEWTLTDAPGRADFKMLCGPGPSCGCTHAYHINWSNEVKGFRCAKPQPSVKLQR